VRHEGWSAVQPRVSRHVPSLVAGLFLIVLVSNATLAPARAETTAAIQTGNPYVFGIASHAWWLDPLVYGEQLLPALDDLGITTVRLTIDWKRFEPVRGEFEWSLYDRVLGELAARNIVVIATFNTIPAWASVDTEGCAVEWLEIYRCQLRDDMYPAYSRAVRAAVSRYAWIQHWEFWNEPEMWRHLGEKGTAYLRNLRIFYDIAHAVNPEIVVAASTLTGADYMGYLYSVSRDWYGAGNEPWDAITFHPYTFDLIARDGPGAPALWYDKILGLHELTTVRSERDVPIWITEFGWSMDVEYQARNLVEALDWLKLQPFIQFAHLHMLHDWNEASYDAFGLMEIVPDDSGRRTLQADTRFVPKQPFYDTYRTYPRDGLPAPPTAEDLRYFPETGQVVSGRFLRAWNERGSLRILGLPLTRPYPRQQPDGTWLLVQDFERARLEFHPNLVGTPYEVLGTLAGNDLTEHRRAEEPFLPLEGCTPDEYRDCYFETGHSLAYTFRSFWYEHGGLMTFGYPISDEFAELNADTGQVYTVQYFERARFEYHPEHADTEFAVLLGRLIAHELDAAGWDWPGSGSRLPTARQH
jgi:hypothetical protein